jgi:DNA-binding response OmpR family regulator
MTLLFVDSNAALRGPRTTWLRDNLPGYAVVDFPDPALAAAWIAKADSLDILVTEAIFPSQETGFALRDTVRARFPQVRVLFCTRYDLTGFEDQIADGLVLKDAPYTPEKLLERVRALLSLPVESNEPPPVMVPGTVLGNYQVLERLYIESEAETYRALQITVQRPVALVLLKPENLQKPEIVAKFKERERVKASLMHPRIAPLYEAGETNGWLFYTPFKWLDIINEADDTRYSFNGTAWVEFGLILRDSGESLRVSQKEEEVTLSGASTNSTITIPDRALVIAVNSRVTQAITGATSFSVGISGDNTRYGNSLGIALDTTNVGMSLNPISYYAATALRFTANGSNFTGGKVRVTVQYLQPKGPWSW